MWSKDKLIERKSKSDVKKKENVVKSEGEIDNLT